ncbi:MULTISPECIES: PQQ-dependent sugar dehydrogenase [unclassified Micromonospora]|uniref:PQQ-dependent sugar dehydrogenase n=1 Tax=Micromonospora TaxID=1873 RepID=UPI00241687C6|nr:MULTISPECIES: PQQ-dependent sugar dehydrogenase [unclassified Micromonospora]MDG4816006.1 PQQ-dependent sugar dehydrogenase [Micromonospora sp. WMMD956]WFE58531.1 PQQ-dependent sugar dehydrogenase [Micromonospora sp. WMMD712]
MPTRSRATLALLAGACAVLAAAPAAAAPPPAGGSTAAAVRPAADTRPPTPPTNLRSSRLTCQSVTLTWSASRDDVGVTNYDVYHDGQLVTSVGGSTLTATLTVAQGVTWGWYVNARDAAGNVSQASATLTVTPPFCQVDTQRPSTPTNLAATVNGTDVRLTWSAATDNVAVTRYDVLRGGTTVGSVTGTAANPPATTFTDTGLAANTQFSYTVVARDAQGNASAASAAVSVRTGSACTSAVCGTTVVTTERDLPWGLVQLSDGTVLYGRRDLFDVVAMNPDGTNKRSIGTVPNAAGTNGEGGVLGLAVASTFATDRWLYIYHTTATDNRIVRMRYDGTLQTSSLQVLVTGIPRNKYHNGGRLRFGPDGMLYAATGDGQTPDRAQDVNDLAGKVLRIRPDGTVPTDNPFGNQVWSYGHRNPQGLAFDSRGRLFEQEFGNNVMDETNIIVRGGNYGWPACEGTVGDCANPNYLAPVRTYPVADASCSGLAIVRDVVYLACLRGNRMYREVISGDTLTDVQQYFVGTYSRLRTVEPTIDGNLWLTTSTGGDKDSVPNNSNERILKVTLGS